MLLAGVLIFDKKSCNFAIHGYDFLHGSVCRWNLEYKSGGVSISWSGRFYIGE